MTGGADFKDPTDLGAPLRVYAQHPDMVCSTGVTKGAELIPSSWANRKVPQVLPPTESILAVLPVQTKDAIWSLRRVSVLSHIPACKDQRNLLRDSPKGDLTVLRGTKAAS